MIGNKIVGFEEKPLEPKSSLIAISCYFYSKKHVIELFKDNSEKNFENIQGIMKRLIDKGELKGYIFSEKWFDIGSFESLRESRRRYF